MKEERPERVLVKKAMRGNPKAFAQLVRTHQEYLYKITFLYTRKESDALDTVQSSILKAYQKIHTLKDPDLFKTWISRIVINTARDDARQYKSNLNLEEAGEVAAPAALPLEEKLDLYQALERLPEHYRDLVKLKYFDGLTIREIAQSTGMPQGTVSVYLSRALKALRKDLGEEVLIGEETALCKKV